MILGTGNKSPASSGSGFTLIEILLVIALIAVASTVVLLNFTSLTDRGDSTSPVEVLTKAVREARFIAAAERITTKLYYDMENDSLRIEPTGDEFPIHSGPESKGRSSVRFYLIPPSIGLAPLAGPDEARQETNAVAFAPDRSSSPFVAEIDLGTGRPARLHFDPFSNVLLSSE